MIVNVYGAQAPAYSLSSAKRDMPLPRQAVENPGPGSYSTPRALDRKASHISLSQSKRFDLKPRPIPGPGEYEVTSDFDKLGVRSFSQKSIGDHTRSRSHSGDQAIPPKYPTIKNTVPGPGYYDSGNVFKTPNLAISKARREFHPKNDLPGPGYYDPPREFGHSQHLSDVRSADMTPEKRSGLSKTGAMSLDNWQRRFGGYKFSQSKRDPGIKNKVPGPGEYDWKDTPKGGLIVSKSPKTTYDKYRASLPGPGYYDADAFERGRLPAYSFNGRKEPKYNDIPGPGSYDADLNPKLGKVLISKAPRMMAPKNTSPGPGSYEIPTTIATASRKK